MTRKPRTWESVYWASRRRGDDPTYSLFLADEWQKRQERKQMSEKNAPNPNADALRAIFEKAGAIEDAGYTPAAAKAPEQVPSVGRIVHVVTFDGQHRPAIVLDPVNNITIKVLAFTDPRDHINDQGNQAGSVAWFIEHCPRDQVGQEPGTWHWPERV